MQPEVDARKATQGTDDGTYARWVSAQLAKEITTSAVREGGQRFKLHSGSSGGLPCTGVYQISLEAAGNHKTKAKWMVIMVILHLLYMHR